MIERACLEDVFGKEFADFLLADVADIFVRVEFQDVGDNMIVQLRGEELAEHIVVVVAGRDGEVDFCGPVRLVAALRLSYKLVSLNHLPPQGVEVLVGIGV